MNKKINTILVLLSILSLFIGTLSISFADGKTPFIDLQEDHWAYCSVMEMGKTGIITGYPDGSFRPNKPVSYGEFIKMVAVADGSIGENVGPEAGAHWAKPYYQAGLNNFYFSEWDISERSLDNPIPRKHMALIASGAMGWRIKVDDYGDYNNIQDSIWDVDYQTPYEYEIVKAYATGILSGYPDGSFRPEGALTRAEAAIVIIRLQNLLESINKTMKDTDNPEDQGSDMSETWQAGGATNIYRDDINDLVAVEKDPIGFTKGTIDFRMFNYIENKAERHVKLLELLKSYFPDEGVEMHKVLIEFASKPMEENQQAIRKQYFGVYPVLMERHGGIVGMYVFPIGYEKEYWNVRPGQVQEEFF